MSAPAGAIVTQQGPDALQHFLDLTISGLEEENKLLTAAGSTIHSTAGSIYFAYCETAYAYLIRRSLALGGFACQVSYEQPYRSFPTQHVDLQITLPGKDQSPSLCGIEMKWVVDEGDKALGEVLNDIAKLLAEPALQRRFVLLMPMCSTVGPVDAHHFAEHLKEFQATNPANWRAFEHRVIGQRSFQAQPHDFGLALIEVFPVV